MMRKFKKLKKSNGPWKYWIKQVNGCEFACDYNVMQTEEAKSKNFYFKLESKKHLSHKMHVGWCLNSNRFRIYSYNNNKKYQKRKIPLVRIKNDW